MHSIITRPITMRRTVIGIARISLLLLFAAFAGVSKAPAQIVGVSITVAPPELPVYDQPPLPGPGYIWTPGYWAWDDGDYYWVPGTWCEPPSVGLLWTPGYWGWHDGIYAWNAGYWGPHVGFYGGVVYGFGYVGVGYAGGFWRGGVFSYNRTVNNFGSVHITNVYNTTVINNSTTKVSFNGGTGGTTAKATQNELAAANDRHVAATSAQTQHQQMASTQKELRHSVNGGHPTIAATSNAANFKGAGVMAARHDGGAAGGAGHSGGAGGTPGALNTGHGVGVTNTPKLTNTSPAGANTQKLTNTSINRGPGANNPSSAGPGANHPSSSGPGAHVGGGTPHPGGVTQTPKNFGGGVHTGGNPGGFTGGAPGGGSGPRVNTNVARFNASRSPAPRAPAPRGPAPHKPQH